MKDYLAEGDWEDVILEINGEEKQLSTITSIDRKTFLEIRKAQKELRAEKNKGKYTSTEGLDETFLKAIELKKKGGRTSELLETVEKLQNPVANLDLDNEQTQVDLIYGKLQSQGWEHEDIIDKLQKLKKDFKLDVTAKGIATEVDKLFREHQTAELQRQEQEIVKKNEAEKEYRKNLQDTYKQFSLNENKIRTLVDNATKKDATGKTNFDKLIDEVKSDPKKLAEINFLLNDEKGFYEFKTAKLKNNEALKTIKIISTIDKTSKSNKQETEELEAPQNRWEKMFAEQK